MIPMVSGLHSHGLYVDWFRTFLHDPVVDAQTGVRRAAHSVAVVAAAAAAVPPWMPARWLVSQGEKDRKL